jgi:hypothetical protein
MNITPQIIEALNLHTSTSMPEQQSSNANEAAVYSEREKRRDIPVPLPKKREIYADDEPAEAEDEYNNTTFANEPAPPKSNIVEPTERQIVAKDTNGNNAYRDAYSNDNSPLTTSGMEGDERLQRIAAQLNRENVRKKIIATREKMAKGAEKYNTAAANINDRLNQVANTDVPFPSNIALGQNKPKPRQNNAYFGRVKRTQPDYFGDFDSGGSPQDVIFGGMGNFNQFTHTIPRRQPKQTKQQTAKVDNTNYDPFGFGGLSVSHSSGATSNSKDMFPVGMSFDVFGVGSSVKPKSKSTKAKTGKGKPKQSPARKPSGQAPYRLGGGIF